MKSQFRIVNLFFLLITYVLDAKDMNIKSKTNILVLLLFGIF